MKKRSVSLMLDDAREELVSLRTVPDGGEGHTKADELRLGNNRAARFLGRVTPEVITVIGAASLGAHLASYTDGFKLSLKSITRILETETPAWEVVRMSLQVNKEIPTLFTNVTDQKHIRVVTDAVVIAAKLRKEMVEQHLTDMMKKEGPNE